MNPATNAVFVPAIVDARKVAPAAAQAPRPFYWSVRRELWENRSIVVAALAIATFAVVALVVHAITMPSHMPGLLANDPASRGSAFSTYTIASILLLLTMPVVAAFYCVDALSGERRDRSILFWKSLPVSDRTTVLAKAAIPLLVLPLITFAATVAMHVTLLLLSVAALLIQGESVAPLWRELQLWRMWPSLLFALGATALWLAPVYAFLLLLSGWARRTAALWAVLPLLAIGVLEKLAFDTLYVQALVQHRVFGWYFLAFVPTGNAPLSSSTPGRFLTSPALWLGLALAVAFLAAAVLLRRHRESV